MYLVLLKQYRDELGDCFVWTLISFANRLLFIIVHLIQWLQIRDRNKVRTVPVTGQEKTGDKENSMLPSEIFHMSMSKCTNVGQYFFITIISIRAQFHTFLIKTKTHAFWTWYIGQSPVSNNSTKWSEYDQMLKLAWWFCYQAISLGPPGLVMLAPHWKLLKY